MTFRGARLLCLVGLIACGGAPPPGSSLSALSAALRDRRYDDAYALMSARYRERTSPQEFRDSLIARPEVAASTIESLRALEGPIEETAVVSVADGEIVHLAPCDARFCIATDLVDRYDQSTPRAALRAFVRAAEQRRYDVLLRLVPNADREGVTPETLRALWQGEGRDALERTVAGLRVAFDNPIEELGTRATMRYGGTHTARLVQENGAWKIDHTE